MQLRNVTKARIAVENLELADNIAGRFIGLMGRKNLADDSGLLITKCNSIHMFFMRFAIDAVFIDREMTVVRIVRNLQPWRLAGCRDAAHTLELSAGGAQRCGIDTGDEVEVVEHVLVSRRAPFAEQPDP